MARLIDCAITSNSPMCAPIAVESHRRGVFCSFAQECHRCYDSPCGQLDGRSDTPTPRVDGEDNSNVIRPSKIAAAPTSSQFDACPGLDSSFRFSKRRTKG